MVDIGGNNYLISSDDDYLEYIANGFEPEMVKLFHVLAANSKVTLDIGANIGCTAILFSALSEWVYAFEPSPTTFAYLERNVLNSRRNNVFAHNIEVGDSPGKYTLAFSPANRSGGFVTGVTQGSAGHTVEEIVIRPLDEVVSSLGLEHVDFIKIDVEGFEGRVLSSAKNTLLSSRPTVVLELNHWCLNALQRTSIPDFFDLLRSIFPILLAVDGANYMDLHDDNDSYIVMYHHILHMRFPNVVAGFDEARFEEFRRLYEHGFAAN